MSSFDCTCVLFFEVNFGPIFPPSPFFNPEEAQIGFIRDKMLLILSGLTHFFPSSSAAEKRGKQQSNYRQETLDWGKRGKREAVTLLRRMAITR